MLLRDSRVFGQFEGMACTRPRPILDAFYVVSSQRHNILEGLLIAISRYDSNRLTLLIEDVRFPICS